jgi:hypothetical protein
MAETTTGRKKSDMVVLGLLIVLFGGFFLCCEMRELSDSYQYLNQFVSREPGYSLLLKVLTLAFGENYGRALSLFQNLLAVVCIYWLYCRLTGLLSFGWPGKIITLAALLSPHLMTPLMSKTRMVITCSVLTEGVTFSLYYLWMGMMITLLCGKAKKENRSMVLTLLLAMLMSLIRGQLMVCIIVWLMVVSYRMIRTGRIKQVLFVIIAFLLAFGVKSQVTKLYNLKESGIYVNTVSSSPMLLANVLYLSEPEDGADIADDDLRLAYENMAAQVKEQGLGIENASGSLLQRAAFHEAGHETINFEIIVPNLNTYIQEKEGIDVSQYRLLLVRQDEYAAEIFKAVLPRVWKKFLGNYLVIASLGLVRSIGVERSFIPVLVCLLYLAAIALGIFLLAKDNKSPAAHFMFLVLLCIAGTVFGTSIMIECISRYMIYNLPFFYIAGWAMLSEGLEAKCRW